MNQNGLVWRRFRVIKQHLPGCDGNNRYRSRLDEVQGFGFSRDTLAAAAGSGRLARCPLWDDASRFAGAMIGKRSSRWFARPADGPGDLKESALVYFFGQIRTVRDWLKHAVLNEKGVNQWRP